MKTIAPALDAQYKSALRRLAFATMFTRTDGQVFRWIALDIDVAIGGQTYLAAPGVDLSSLVSSEGFAPDNAEITVNADDDITRADILAGIWDGAAIEISQIDWGAATPVKNVLKTGTIGNFKPKRGQFIAEFRDLRQVLQRPHESVLQPTCRYRLGDAKCTVDLASTDYLAFGNVDGSASQYSVTDTSRTEPDDWFGDGYLTFDDSSDGGLNRGLTQKVKTYDLTSDGGVFVFWNQFIFPIGAGDAFSVTPGCRFRFEEDCRDKFDNAANFGGERNPRNPDSLTAPA